MNDKEFKLDLDDPKQIEKLVDSITIAKVIVDEVGENPSYEEAVDIGDKLDITIEQVFAFIRLFKYVQTQMII